MINIIKDGHIIEVTETAYQKVYKGKGYVPYNNDNVGRRKEDKPSIKDLTKAEIIEKLEEKGIEHDSTALKSDLVELLRSDK